MNYYLPENSDYVDPNYNFETEQHGSLGTGWHWSAFSHQIYGYNNFDGVLIARPAVESSPAKKQIFEEVGAKGYARVASDVSVFGDSGAFSYSDDVTPPYTVDDVAYYYSQYNYDMGASLDHMIRGNDPVEDKFRYELTLKNAKEFIDCHHNKQYEYTPVGVIQGYDILSTVEACKTVVNYGYDYVAVGGIARAKSDYVLELTRQIRNVYPNLRLHLFGISRLDIIPELKRLNVTSIDSTSYFRQAWTPIRGHYYAGDGVFYSAIRIPNSQTPEQAELERKCLDLVRNFDKHRDIDSCIDAINKYSHLIRKPVYADEYARTLKDRPWAKCKCKICRNLGIDVLIMRGLNRNYRRGFHNINQFYKEFKQI